MPNIKPSLSERDSNLIWHPFTQMKTAGAHIPIVRGEGTNLIDENGKKYIDAIGSWWVNLHGHGHPYIADKIAAQAHSLEHVMFAGFTHSPAVELCERLQKWLPHNFQKFFFSDNGSTATEIAMKMALQYKSAQDSSPKKYKLIALEGSYHGDTFGAMAVGERDVFVEPFVPYLFDVIYIPTPSLGKEEASKKALAEALEENDVAAFIFEPLIQGAFGMQTYEPEALDDLLDLCAAHDVLSIADEVMTGFFRTGSCFAVNQLRNEVDFICLSKALTGGVLPLSLTVTSEKIYTSFYSDETRRAFFHGHSFTGNPLGCAAALASLDLLERQETQQKIKWLENYMAQKAAEWKDNPSLCAVRQKGIMLALEVAVPEKEGYLSDLGKVLNKEFLERGVLLRPLGEVVYLLPPLCITEEELQHVFTAISEVFALIAQPQIV